MFKELEFLLKPVSILTGAILAGYVLHAVLFYILNKAVKKTDSVIDDAVVKYSNAPVRLLAILFVVNFVMPLIGFEGSFNIIFGHFINICWVASAAWLIIRIPEILKVVLLGRYNIENKDNLKARKIFTQFKVFQKIVTFVVTVLAFALVLMNFDKVRNLGASILASAGIIGIMAGFAGQKMLANIFAGLQIAVAQPFRIDDVVIVENEWGWIEDITLTYVVVKIWDLRRLVLPISYFIEKPFQNWTRQSSDILGTVVIYADYTVPVQAVRDQLQKILEKSSYWDKKVCGLQVTNAAEHTIELRALMSAKDSPSAWDLRCEVREQLINFIQKNYPECLPKQRVYIKNNDITENKEKKA